MQLNKHFQTVNSHCKINLLSMRALKISAYIASYTSHQIIPYQSLILYVKQVTSSVTTTLEEMTINNEQLRRENDALKIANTQLRANNDAMKDEMVQLKANNDKQKDENAELATLLEMMAINNAQQANFQNSETVALKTENVQLKTENIQLKVSQCMHCQVLLCR